MFTLLYALRQMKKIKKLPRLTETAELLNAATTQAAAYGFEIGARYSSMPVPDDFALPAQIGTSPDNPFLRANWRENVEWNK